MTRKATRKIRAAPKPRPDPVTEKARVIGMPEAQIARGHLAIVDVKRGEDERGGTNTTIRNRGGTAVDRWHRAGELTEVQMRAIAYVQGLWLRAWETPSLVADPTRVAGMPGGDGMAQQEAIDELTRLEKLTPTRYWPVFEAVCRHDEPAGTAGSRLATNRIAAITSARLTVCFVADLIVMWRGLTVG